MCKLCARCKFGARERLLRAQETFSNVFNVFLKTAHSLQMSQNLFNLLPSKIMLFALYNIWIVTRISQFAWRLHEFLEVILERPLQHTAITDRNVHHPILS